MTIYWTIHIMCSILAIYLVVKSILEDQNEISLGDLFEYMPFIFICVVFPYLMICMYVAYNYSYKVIYKKKKKKNNNRKETICQKRKK